jgi:hypothetical protein
MGKRIFKTSKPWTKAQWFGFLLLVAGIVVVFGFLIPVSK